MTSAQSRRAITSLVTGLLCLGAVAVAALVLFPLLQDVLTSYRSARDELQTLNSRVDTEVMPTEGVIQQFTDLKNNMTEEAERSASFYLRQNASLDEAILQSWRMDAYQVANSFRELKDKLAEKAGNPEFLELGKLDDWEEQARGKPNKEHFEALEKKSCIANVLTDILTTDPNTVITIMHIEEPFTMEPVEDESGLFWVQDVDRRIVIAPADAPPVPEVDWMVVRYHIYPVNVSFTTRFSTLGKTLHRLVTIPPAASESPCIAVRSMNLQGEDADSPTRVKVELGLNVLDFYEVSEES